MKLGVILSQTDPETVFNGLRLANYSLKQGDTAKVLLLGKGVEFDRIDDPSSTCANRPRCSSPPVGIFWRVGPA